MSSPDSANSMKLGMLMQLACHPQMQYIIDIAFDGPRQFINNKQPFISAVGALLRSITTSATKALACSRADLAIRIIDACVAFLVAVLLADYDRFASQEHDDLSSYSLDDIIIMFEKQLSDIAKARNEIRLTYNTTKEQFMELLSTQTNHSFMIRPQQFQPVTICSEGMMTAATILQRKKVNDLHGVSDAGAAIHLFQALEEKITCCTEAREISYMQPVVLLSLAKYILHVATRVA